MFTFSLEHEYCYFERCTLPWYDAYINIDLCHSSLYLTRASAMPLDNLYVRTHMLSDCLIASSHGLIDPYCIVADPLYLHRRWSSIFASSLILHIYIVADPPYLHCRWSSIDLVGVWTIGGRKRREIMQGRSALTPLQYVNVPRWSEPYVLCACHWSLIWCL